MTKIKSITCAVLLITTISSTVLAGNIPSRSGNIASRTGIISSDSINSDNRFGFSENIARLIQLLLESGWY